MYRIVCMLERRIGIIPNDTPNVFTGDKAYIKVRLADAGTLTRAQGGDFEYGTNEQSIKMPAFTSMTQTVYS